MASGGAKSFVGSFVGTGSAMDIKTPGFRPKHVVVENVTGLARIEWFADMADAAGAKTVTDGTKSLLSSNGITPLSGGFRLGADADLNVAAEVCHFVAVD